MDAKDFLGLSKRTAQDKADFKNIIFRLIRVDTDEFMSYPDEPRTDRVCIEIDNGVVTKALFQ